MAHDVFISYSSKDKPVADAVVAALEAKGVRCWVAPRDILAGMHWGAAIINAISESRALVLIYSSSANTSSQIQREIERAADRNLPIVPFRIEDVRPSAELEYFLSTPHWLDAVGPKLKPGVLRLADVVAQVVAGSRGDGAPGAASPSAVTTAARFGASESPLTEKTSAAPTGAAPARRRTAMVSGLVIVAAALAVGAAVYVRSMGSGSNGVAGAGDADGASASAQRSPTTTGPAGARAAATAPTGVTADVRATATAVLKALQSRDFPQVLLLTALNLRKELAQRMFPRRARGKKGMERIWWEQALEGWDGQLREVRFQSPLEHPGKRWRAHVLFGKPSRGSVAGVTLTWDAGRWWFVELRMTEAVSFEALRREPPTAAQLANPPGPRRRG